jgi:Nucleoside phosphorylase
MSPERSDVLLVVTTDVELSAVFQAASEICGVRQPVGPIHGKERTYHDLGFVGNARAVVVQTEMGSATIGGSLTTIIAAISELKPTTVLMVGIAFGVTEKQAIGSVLVSRQVHQYDLQRVGTDEGGACEIIPRGDKATATPKVLSRLRAAKRLFTDLTFEFGLILSGEKLVDNTDYRETLKEREPEAIGGEMEGAGLYVAATEKQVGWCIVKAVCDYADGKKRENKKERQEKAAQNAARFVLGAVNAGGFGRRRVNASRGDFSEALIEQSSLAPRQLPSPPADFTGRESEVEDLLKALRVGGMILSAAVQGMGGVGKTSLALKLGAMLAPEYPDGQLYIDLKGASQERAVTCSEAMAHVIFGFDPAAKLPFQEERIAGLYRSILQGKRVLLLLDNARDAAQVAPLNPPPGCLLLVTSRQQFALPGLVPKLLDTFPPEVADAFVLKLAPRVGAYASELSKLCGYLALALRVSASTLATRRNLGPAEYIEMLRDTKEHLGLVDPTTGLSVTASVRLSYNLLAPTLQERWRALAVFPGTFDATSAAAVWSTQKQSAVKSLSSLLEYSLVEWNEATERYRLHDLVRQVADERLGPE